MKYIINLIEKDKQTESLVEKLCHRWGYLIFVYEFIVTSHLPFASKLKSTGTVN